MRGLLIPVDPAEPVRDIEAPDTYSEQLPFLREAMGGGWVEMVHTSRLQDTIDRSKTPRVEKIVMLVDEEGAVKNLPINPRATLLYAPGVSNIHGPALIFGEHRDPMEGDDIVSLPEYYTIDHLNTWLTIHLGTQRRK